MSYSASSYTDPSAYNVPLDSPTVKGWHVLLSQLTQRNVPAAESLLPALPSMPPVQTLQRSMLSATLDSSTFNLFPDPPPPGPVVKQSRKERDAMFIQWDKITALAIKYFRRDYICLITFLERARTHFGGPGKDPVLEGAIARAVDEVTQHMPMIGKTRWILDRLPLVFHSISPVYQESAQILEDHFERFFPEFEKPNNSSKFTKLQDEWHIARREIAVAMRDRAEGYLHLVSTVFPLLMVLWN